MPQHRLPSSTNEDSLAPAPPLLPRQGARVPRPPPVMETHGTTPTLPSIRRTRSLSKPYRAPRVPSEAIQLLNATLSDAPPFFRTFDKKEGRVVLHSTAEIPDPEKRTGSILAGLRRDTYEVEQAELRVTKLSEVEQVRLAAMALKRKAQRELERATRKGLLDADAALVRTQQTLLADFNDAVGHLGTDTQELSLIRVHNAATDEVLFQKAQYLAKLEMDRFRAIVISDDVSPTEILSLQLDAYRNQHVVPFPAPRKRRSELELPLLDGRRRSSDRGQGGGGGGRTGIHSIVEKQLNALHR